MFLNEVVNSHNFIFFCIVVIAGIKVDFLGSLENFSYSKSTPMYTQQGKEKQQMVLQLIHATVNAPLHATAGTGLWWWGHTSPPCLTAKQGKVTCRCLSSMAAVSLLRETPASENCVGTATLALGKRRF